MVPWRNVGLLADIPTSQQELEVRVFVRDLLFFFFFYSTGV
jgi:hypothetical protein